jgi:sialate O-acetylesterase
MKRLISSFLVCSLLTFNTMFGQGLSLSSIFANGMVLQQNTKAKIWGTAKPQESISIKASWGETVSVVADADGKWNAFLPTHKAGGPFDISVSSKQKTVKLDNVLLGEVWLCSGQSNMEMPVSGWPPLDTIIGSAKAIAQSKNSQIRMFTVERSSSLKKETNCVGKWEEASPENTDHFSATAYFYARKLYAELGVPIGILHSSWGGTAAEAWISSDMLSTLPDFKDIDKQNQTLLPKQKEYTDWLLKHKKIAVSNKPENEKWTNLDFDDILCSNPETNISAWPSMMLPCQSWEAKEIGEFDGVVWFRRTFDLAQSMLTNDFVLKMPGVDDMDRVYINGVLVGETELLGYWHFPRTYKIPKNVLKAGTNSIAIRVLDNQGGGGVGSTQSSFEIISTTDTAKTVKLSGEWKYNIAAELKNGIFYVLDVASVECLRRPKCVALGSGTVSGLYNAMIHPIAAYTIKGALWYQGETNVGRAMQYQSLLPLVAHCWRESWNQGSFPFYVVQIAPWIYSGIANTDAAELRDAQRIACNTIDNSGLVVTLDLGDTSSIHPGKKIQVGERLALWALAKEYNKQVICSGPQYKSSKVLNNKIELTFDYVQNGIVITDLIKNGFQIAGSDKKFVEAKIEIMGDKVIVSSDAITVPSFVRYAYLNASKATFYNKEGLPASTFITE